jgi:membrane protease YdiL (CAAX protease family)
VQESFENGSRDRLNPPEVGRLRRTRLALRLLAAMAIAITFSAVATYLISAHPPGKSPEKIARLFFIAGFLFAYGILGRSDRPKLAQAAALTDLRSGRPLVARGFAAGAGSLAVFLAVSVALGWWAPLEHPDPWLKVLGRAAFYLPAGLFLALWEEGLFRGVVFGDVARAAGPRAALWVSTLLFGWSHLLGPLPGTSVAWDAPNVGTAAITANFVGIAKVTDEWPKLLGLLLVGYVLARLRMRTGSAWLGVGVHAGWYYVQQMDGRFLRFAVPEHDPLRMWSGSPEYADGVAGFTALWLTYLVARRFVPAAPEHRS